MDDTRLQRIWEEIIEEGKKSASGRREGEITIYDYMELTGQSHGQAKKSLNNLIAQGKITVRRKVYVNELKTAVNLYVPVIK